MENIASPKKTEKSWWRNPYLGALLAFLMLPYIVLFLFRLFFSVLYLPEFARPEIIKQAHAAVPTRAVEPGIKSQQEEKVSSSVGIESNPASNVKYQKMNSDPTILYVQKDILDIATRVLDDAKIAVDFANKTNEHLTHVVEMATQVIIILFSIGGALFGVFGWHKFKDFEKEQEAKLTQLYTDIVEKRIKNELEVIKTHLQQDMKILGDTELLNLREKNQEKIHEVQDEIRRDFKKIKLEAGGFKKDKLAIVDLMTGMSYTNIVHLMDENKTPIQNDLRMKMLKVADSLFVRALSQEPHQLRIKAHILEWRAFVVKRLFDKAGCYLMIREAIEIYEKEQSATVRVYSNGACYACFSGDIARAKEWIEKGMQLNSTAVINAVEIDEDLKDLRLQADYADWFEQLKQKYTSKV